MPLEILSRLLALTIPNGLLFANTLRRSENVPWPKRNGLNKIVLAYVQVLVWNLKHHNRYGSSKLFSSLHCHSVPSNWDIFIKMRYSNAALLPTFISVPICQNTFSPAFGQTEICAFLVIVYFHLSLLSKVHQSLWKVITHGEGLGKLFPMVFRLFLWVFFVVKSGFEWNVFFQQMHFSGP